MQYKLVLMFILVLFSNMTFSMSIVNTKHNLSISGQAANGNSVFAINQTEICVFCHTPHSASLEAPLWNRRAGVLQTYIPYSSNTLSVQVGQPTGSSLLCLSCHDGTIAIGDVINGRPAGGGPIQMTGTDAQGRLLAPVAGVVGVSNGNLTTNLSSSHPISFRFVAGVGFELKDPATLPAEVKLDGNLVQCSTCHDPHDDTNGQFLVISNAKSMLCEACHDKTQWAGSPHKLSTNTWNGVAPTPWPNGKNIVANVTTVADQACSNCHAAHNAQLPVRLLTQTKEEDVCFVCHNGNVVRPPEPNIQADFMAPMVSIHPLSDVPFTRMLLPPLMGAIAGTHQPNIIETGPIVTRHVECVDCHNAHAGKSEVVNVVGISGISWSGVKENPVTQKEHLCFKCHGANPNPGTLRPKTIPRVFNEEDVRKEFALTNPTYHPLLGASTQGSLSLLPPWIIGTPALRGSPSNVFKLKNPKDPCGICHITKPHGSPNPALLNLKMAIVDGSPNSLTTYELCYSCHDMNIIIGATAFVEHNEHVVSEMVSCMTCHTPHGSSTAAGALITNSRRLVNFNTNEAKPVGALPVAWTGTGNNMGTCTLICHGETHNKCGYGGAPGGICP